MSGPSALRLILLRGDGEETSARVARGKGPAFAASRRNLPTLAREIGNFETRERKVLPVPAGHAGPKVIGDGFELARGGYSPNLLAGVGLQELLDLRVGEEGA